MRAMRLLCVAACALGSLFFAGLAAAAPGISGRVVDSADAPLAGIEVCAESHAPIGGGAVCTTTAGDGAYSLPAAGPGYFVHFYARGSAAPGYAPQWWPGVPFYDEAGPVAESDLAHVDATMQVGGSFSGRVLSRANEAPIEGVEICPDPTAFHAFEVGFCAKSDADGEFALRGLSEGEYRFEFLTAGDVNFVGTSFGPVAAGPGRGIGAEVFLVPGVEVKGTVTEAGTGDPIEGLPAPHSVPRVCALDADTEEPAKCTTVGPAGQYSIPGLEANRFFRISFAVDVVEEGLDLHPDGYARQYWDHESTFEEAVLIGGGRGAVVEAVDAALSPGEEVFPRCEVPTASCEVSGEVGGGAALPGTAEGSGSSLKGPFAPPGAPGRFPLLPPVSHAVGCKPGFHRVSGVSSGCVKIKKAKKKHHRHKRGKPRRPTHAPRHT
jgi:hypothetical protein